MLSKNLKDLIEISDKNKNIEKELREYTQKKLGELKKTDKIICNAIINEFIENYKGTEEEIEFMMKKDSPVSRDRKFLRFRDEKLHELGFLIGGYNNDLANCLLHIDLSEREQTKKALTNTHKILAVLRSAVSVEAGGSNNLIHLIINGEWDEEKVGGFLYLTEKDGQYQVLIGGNHASALSVLFSSENTEDLIFEQLIPYLNENCQ